jgi:hypothetical protein
MKSRYVLTGVLLIGLVACGQQTNSPNRLVPADAVAVESAVPVNELRESGDEVTGEQIQKRREAWVRSDARSSMKSRVASSGATPR